MSILHSSIKCESCGSRSFSYDKKEKVWICNYCGNKIVREEKYDGLFTIKNVVRQVIIDCAYRRIDSAYKNLIECEKIDSQYIGTVISRICYRFIKLITPGACGANEFNTLKQRLFDDYNDLKHHDDGIAEDEEAIYDFISKSDSADDAFAQLLSVFNNRDNAERYDYIMQMIDLEKIYSRECNTELLAMMLQKGEAELASKIIKNKDNIDLSRCLDIVLNECQDCEEKITMVCSLLKEGAYDMHDKNKLEKYFMGPDSAQTKCAVLGACAGKEIKPDMPVLVQYVFANADEDALKEALKGVIDGHLPDNDLNELLSYAFTTSIEKAKLILNAVVESGQFVAVNYKLLEALFMNKNASSDEKNEKWNLVNKLEVDERATEKVFATYLNEMIDTPEERIKVLTELEKTVTRISEQNLENYILNFVSDADKKAQIVKSIFAMKNMKPSFFGQALGNYVNKSKDSPEVKNQVIKALTESGLTINTTGFNSIITDKSIPSSSKLEMLRQMESSGSTIGTDVLSEYLISCYNQFDQSLFTYLYGKTTRVSNQAVYNYIMYCDYNSANKTRNISALASKQAVPMGTAMCKFKHGSSTIEANLTQAYILNTPDSYEMSSQVLLNMSGKMNDDIAVNGIRMKFKRYVKDYRECLSEVSAKLCEDNRLFSLF